MNWNGNLQPVKQSVMLPTCYPHMIGTISAMYAMRERLKERAAAPSWSRTSLRLSRSGYERAAPFQRGAWR